MTEKELTQRLDVIQSLIWAKVRDELVAYGIETTLEQSYIAGASIKEVLHPEVRKLIDELKPTNLYRTLHLGDLE